MACAAAPARKHTWRANILHLAKRARAINSSDSVKKCACHVTRFYNANARVHNIFDSVKNMCVPRAPTQFCKCHKKRRRTSRTIGTRKFGSAKQRARENEKCHYWSRIRSGFQRERRGRSPDCASGVGARAQLVVHCPACEIGVLGW